MLKAHVFSYHTFSRVSVVRYDCRDPYMILDETDSVISHHETEMTRIQESASLFEVNVPDFKQLKQCRRELRMLKVRSRSLASSHSRVVFHVAVLVLTIFNWTVDRLN